MFVRGATALSVLLAVGACDGDGDPPMPTTPTIAVSYEASDDLYAAPWPDERLRLPSGEIDTSLLPISRRATITSEIANALRDVRGFPRSAGIFFAATVPLDAESLPDMLESRDSEASVFLMDVDPTSPARLARAPIDVAFFDDLGPYGSENVLALLPVQGVPLRADTLYAAVVTNAVRSADGDPLEPAEATANLLAGRTPDGLSDQAAESHRIAVEALTDAGLATETIVATAVFRTDRPSAGLARAVEQVLDDELPAFNEAFELSETYEEYCVYGSTIDMPVYQTGEPPYSTDGGAWGFDDTGELVVHRNARSRVWLTLPRGEMPEGGFPTVLFVRTGGGGDRPLVDRGPRDDSGEAAPGSGPAGGFAQAGYAGISVDGPLGGARNLAEWDEQFAIFNINNPPALRDNIRQSALELVLFAHVLDSVAVDASSCADLVITASDGLATLNAEELVLMGHSMGATIAPLAATFEDRFSTLILSGAGGSWIQNVIYKESPIPVRSTAELVLDYPARDFSLSEYDPMLSLLQWAGEAADPQLYGEALRERADRHVLMFQGFADTFIPPPIANALSLPLGLDLAGPELEAWESAYRDLSTLLPLVGGQTLSLPVRGNRAEGRTTAVVVQHPEDGIEDGHEVMFQSDAPRNQYRCFLESLRTDETPVVGPGDDTCP